MPSRTRFTPFAVLAVAAVTLSACNNDGGSSQQDAPVTLTSLEVGPAAAGGVVASVAAPVQFTATGSYSNGTSANLTSAVTWSSSNVDAATFSSDAGLMTPVAVGSTEVTATHPASGLHSSVSLSIVAADLVQLEITPLDSDDPLRELAPARGDRHAPGRVHRRDDDRGSLDLLG